MCDEVVSICLFVFDCITDWSKTQEMRDRLVFEVPFLIVYCPDKYKTQPTCDEAAAGSLVALKRIADWVVTS